MATPTRASESNEESLEDRLVAIDPSLGDEHLPTMDLESLGASKASLEEESAEVVQEGEGEGEDNEAAKQKDQEMDMVLLQDREAIGASIPGTHGGEKHTSQCDKPCEVWDLKIAAKPSLSQEGLYSATQPATTTVSSRRVDVMESHKVEVLGEIEPMPTSTCVSLSNEGEALRPAPFRRSKRDLDNTTCPDTTRVSQRRPQSAPGAYAVQMVRTTPPSFTQCNAPASSSSTSPVPPSPASPGIGTADDEASRLMVMEQEVRQNQVVASPILHRSSNSNSYLDSMNGLQYSNSPGDYLAEANPVLEEAEDETVTPASPMDLHEVQKRQLQRVRREKLYGLIFCLFILAAAIIVGSVVGTHLNKLREEGATQVPTSHPSMELSEVPSPAPTGVLDLLFMDLPLHTQDSILNGNTPQYQAWEWLSKHQNITNLPDWRRKQLFALAAFYFAFEGENWNPLIRERWMDDTKDECLWFSSGFGRFDEGGEYVEWSMELDKSPQVDPCNSQGEFIWLELLNLQLSGFAPSIPPEIVLLTSLSFIALNENDLEVPFAALLPANFSGLIYSEQGDFNSLGSLVISDNSMSGPIPSELGLLTNMTLLYIENNAFSGSICSELGDMTSLEDLTMFGNSFSGTIPSELGRLTNLVWLDLSNLPLLTGSIPSELSLLSSLRYLDLRNSSGLSGTIPASLCYIKSASCIFLDWWGGTYNCTLDFDCTDFLCGCDCPCAT
jgi:hypothetical protein